MNANMIKDFLNMHGVPYTYKNHAGEVYEFGGRIPLSQLGFAGVGNC